RHPSRKRPVVVPISLCGGANRPTCFGTIHPRPPFGGDHTSPATRMRPLYHPEASRHDDPSLNHQGGTLHDSTTPEQEPNRLQGMGLCPPVVCRNSACRARSSRLSMVRPAGTGARASEAIFFIRPCIMQVLPCA